MRAASRPPRVGQTSANPRGNKSFFASVFSEKADSSFSEEKEAKRLLCPAPPAKRA
jgi:hypothetical protein